MAFRSDTEAVGPSAVSAVTGQAAAETVDAAGRAALASDDVFLAVLVELRIANLLLAQVCGCTDDLAAMRDDPELRLV